MSLDTKTFVDAVSAHLGPEVALRLEASLLTIDVNEGGVGRALAVALSSASISQAMTEIDQLKLLRVDILTEDRIELAPADAFAHMLCRDWLRSTFAELVAECVDFGRTGADLAPAAPIFSRFELHEDRGKIRAATVNIVMESRSGPVTLVVWYGTPLTGNLARVTVCTGDSIFMVGSAQRSALPSVEAAASAAASIACAPLVH